MTLEAIDYRQHLSPPASSVLYYYEGAQKTETDSITLGWRQRLNDNICDIAERCFADSWDGEGALPISEYAVEAAKRFVELLPEGIMMPFITPENTDEFAFDWDIEKNMTFAVIIDGDYAFWAGIIGEEREKGKARIYGEMPDAINEILTKYFKT